MDVGYLCEGNPTGLQKRKEKATVNILQMFQFELTGTIYA